MTAVLPSVDPSPTPVEFPMNDLPQQPARPYSLNDLMPTPTLAPAPPGRPVDRTAALLTLGAGVGILLGSFLPWASVTAPLLGRLTVAGTDGPDGWITAAIGAAIAAYAAVMTRRPLPWVLGAMAGLGGLGVAGLAVWKIVDLQSRVADMKAGMVRDGDEFGIAERMADAVHAQIGVGLWLLVGAGLVAAASVGWSLLRRRPPVS